MFTLLQTLYGDGRLSRASLARAVTKEWITQDQYDEIVGTP